MSSTPVMIKSSQPLLFLFGPTAVGKSSLITSLFSENYQIISADSKQVYRHLDIGSAKVEKEIQQKIKHHLIDIIDPSESFSVGQFVKLADEAVAKIYLDEQIPIISGGTAYYFKHFLFGLPPSPKSDPISRSYVKELLDKHGQQWLYQQLEQIDPIAVKKIHPSDAYRITRALEVYYATGKPLSSFALSEEPRNNLKPLLIGLNRERDELKELITKRVDQMFAEGLVDEIKKLKEMGAKQNWPGMEGIGYREFFDEKGSYIFDQQIVAPKIVSNSVKYTKRQLTFFKSLPNVNWVHPSETTKIKNLVDLYLNSFN